MTDAEQPVVMPTHAPPKFLVVLDPGPDATYHCFDDGVAAVEKMRDLARHNPEAFIDVYQHLTAIRHRE